jgi:hypothetical protein
VTKDAAHAAKQREREQRKKAEPEAQTVKRRSETDLQEQQRAAKDRKLREESEQNQVL